MTNAEREAVRRNMRSLLRVVEQVREQHPRMELSQLAILLHVLSDPGIRAADLQDRVSLKKSALSRNVKALAQESYLTDEAGNPREGLDLIVQLPDPQDGRAFQLVPTRTGLALAERLSNLMKE